MGVDSPLYLSDGLREFRRQCGIASQVGPRELDVDCGWQSEVQDLRDDVGWLEEELHTRKALGQFRTQARDKTFGGRVAFVQRHQYLAIECADGSRIAVRQINAAVGHTEVVQNGLQLVSWNDLANGNFHSVGQPRRLLNAGAGGGAHVQAYLAGVDAGEEVATQHP